jgi:hypothetical protein
LLGKVALLNSGANAREGVETVRGSTGTINAIRHEEIHVATVGRIMSNFAPVEKGHEATCALGHAILDGHYRQKAIVSF